ncbi:MAG: Enoyl-CoA hydratase/isomerase [Myxococcales bacterium]|nr:Enoyl-CoA hydratase/isomerase [Myxococcales bacterium]
MADPLSYALDNKLAIIQMDDGKANALSNAMIQGLIAALARAEQEASAVVLAGRAERFCAGFDLRVMMSSPAAATEMLRAGSDLLMNLYGATIPVVIACTGHALAGGALVVLTGDYRVGAAGPFKLGLNEVSIGLPVPVLAMELARDRLLPTELGHATLEAKIYNPEQAVAAGYLDVVVAPEETLARAKDEANRLGALSRNAFRGTKTRLRGKTIDYIRAKMDDDMRTLLAP